MVRKLFLTSALLFVLGVAFMTKPAVAAAQCDCEFCAAAPGAQCIDDWGFRWLCSQYVAFRC
jgi:hypothetical protein